MKEKRHLCLCALEQVLKTLTELCEKDPGIHHTVAESMLKSAVQWMKLKQQGDTK